MSRANDPMVEDEETEWRFDLDEVGPDGIVDDDDDDRLPIEPGAPSAENVLFVLLGVLLAVGLLVVTVFPNAV